jgi:SAM-dependent methyltransferase
MSTSGEYKDSPLLAEIYDLVPAWKNRTDMEFYLDISRNIDGNILEIGCGTGRILIPAAKFGSKVTGLDISESMLGKCREKLRSADQEMVDRVQLIKGDAKDFKLDSHFGLVIIPNHGFQHMITVEDQMACLKNISRHLEKRGRLVFDVSQPDPGVMSSIDKNGEIEETPEFQLDGGSRLRLAFRVPSMSLSKQVRQVEFIYYLTGPDGETTRTVQTFPLRLFYRYEVEHLLARCGFEIIDLYGNFDKSRLEDDSPEMIFVCQKMRDVDL